MVATCTVKNYSPPTSSSRPPKDIQSGGIQRQPSACDSTTDDVSTRHPPATQICTSFPHDIKSADLDLSRNNYTNTPDNPARSHREPIESAPQEIADFQWTLVQPTDLTPQEPENSDLAHREIEAASSYSLQKTESVSLAPYETETGSLASCQNPEAARLAAHEIAPQDPESGIRPQGPEVGEGTDAGHCDATNVSPLTNADPPLPKLSTDNVEPPNTETYTVDSLKTVNIDALGTKTADPTSHESQIISVDISETSDAVAPKTENSGHSPTRTGPALVSSPGDTNENPIVLDNLAAGDSRYNPIEIPDDPIKGYGRKRKRSPQQKRRWRRAI